MKKYYFKSSLNYIDQFKDNNPSIIYIDSIDEILFMKNQLEIILIERDKYQFLGETKITYSIF